MKRFSAFGLFAFAVFAGAVAAKSTHNPLIGYVTATAVAATYMATQRGYAFGVDPAGTKTDGSIMFGAQSTLIPTWTDYPTNTVPGTSFDLEKISVKRGSTRHEQKNIVGVTGKKFHVRNLKEGTAVAQYPTATTPSPAEFSIFTLKAAGSGALVQFLLEEVGEEFDHEGETKANLTFSIMLNP
jgi:hypothetical protein